MVKDVEKLASNPLLEYINFQIFYRSEEEHGLRTTQSLKVNLHLLAGIRDLADGNTQIRPFSAQIR